jgi:hypothetical protein
MATSKQIKTYMAANNCSREQAVNYFSNASKATPKPSHFSYEEGTDFNSNYELPERLWVIVTGETEVVEFTLTPEMFKESSFETGLSSELARATIATMLGKRLNRPELGKKSIMQVETEEQICEVAKMIIGYVGTSKWLKNNEWKKFRKPCVMLGCFKLENELYGIRKFGFTEFPNEFYHSDYEKDGGSRSIGNYTYINEMRPEFICGLYVATNKNSIKVNFKNDTDFIHKDSFILRALSLSKTTRTPSEEEHASGWHWNMTQETKDKISNALLGMRYKTKSREGKEWHWVNGKKEWL